MTQLAKATRAAYLMGKPATERSEAETAEVFNWWLDALDQVTLELTGRLGRLENEEKEIKKSGTVAHVMQERTEPPVAFVLFRGDYDKRRDQVSPGTPAALPPMPADLPRNRLGLAQWLLRPEHPLTARVTVNRFWQELFGSGLVRTAGDFGVSGETPSHPELLDWMAVELRESGWDMKKFYRLLVTSAAYRQAATVTPEKLEKDRTNRLLSRGPRYRLDAEVVRDYALASSGLLVHKIGGPSVRPYQPPGVWEAVAMMVERYTRLCAGPRRESVSPQHVHILEAQCATGIDGHSERSLARVLHGAARADQYADAGSGGAERSAVHRGGPISGPANARRGGRQRGEPARFSWPPIARAPWRMEELAVLEGSVANLVAYYQGHVEEAKQLIAVGESPADASLDAATLAGWTMLANEIMNLDEVINK